MPANSLPYVVGTGVETKVDQRGAEHLCGALAGAVVGLIVGLLQWLSQGAG
jgi:hypothetical protein